MPEGRHIVERRAEKDSGSPAETIIVTAAMA
jgi:hypothetical protein